MGMTELGMCLFLIYSLGGFIAGGYWCWADCTHGMGLKFFRMLLAVLLWPFTIPIHLAKRRNVQKS